MPRTARSSAIVGCTIAGLVDGARLQQRRLAVPAPFMREARQRLRQHRLLSRARCQLTPPSNDTSTCLMRPLPRPGKAADFIDARAFQRLFRAGKRDDRFGVDQPGEAARRAVGHQLGVFRRLLAREPGLVADLDAAQPFDVHVALPARNDQPQRKALLRPQRLAVLRHRRRDSRRGISRAAGCASCARASAPSTSTHLASFLRPTSSSSVDSLTPVHSAQLTMPWVNCSELSCAARHSMPPLAGHSMKVNARDRRESA